MQPPTPDWVHRLQGVKHMRPRRISETWSVTLVADTGKEEIFIAEAIAPTAEGAQAIAEVLSRALMSYAGVR